MFNFEASEILPEASVKIPHAYAGPVMSSHVGISCASGFNETATPWYFLQFAISFFIFNIKFLVAMFLLCFLLEILTLAVGFMQ